MANASNKNIVSFLNSLYVVSLIHHLTVSGELPSETFFIYCGSGQNYTASDGRNWIGDISSEFFPFENGGASSTYNVPPEERIFDPPFAYARFSHSEFTYRFPVRAGQKYIRLHFYPYSYESFHRSKASFWVKTGGYTLLSNFNASLAADALDSLTISKEFVINCEEDQILNITFKPTRTINGDAYAFINGIEVVSMPDYIYYTAPQEGGFQFIGQQNSFFIETDYALENVYRLNVGGISLSPANDTGMFRTWAADGQYCAEPAGFVRANTSADPKFTQIRSYTAPVEVYQSARSMGNNKTENMGYNLTWVLPVDSGFSYLLRLHFCEFQPEIQEQHDREFTILISNETAEKHADVITWSGGNGVPIYRDYGILMPQSQGSDKKQNLYIQLHPNLDYRTVYNDAILNGIELFKLSNFKHELAVDLDIPTAAAQPTSRESDKMMKLYVAIIGSAVGAVVIAVPILYMFAMHQMKTKIRKRDHHPGLGLRDRGRAILCLGPVNSSSDLKSNLCRRFSLQEIKTATKNFDKGYILGEGGFGTVYKGHLNMNMNMNGGIGSGSGSGSGTTTVGVAVAIKRLNPDSRQGAHEFTTEIEMLSQLRYIHLVSLVGYCHHKREMILAYEYMANGNLRDHLYNSTTHNPPLPWTLRLQICIGAARGLHYLHAGVKKPIIHRDVKTSNILLDHKWVAKVSDFGLSKMSPTSVANAHISTVVKGSFGYLDPEYFRFQRLNEKSDVYSFGVVLFEVLCARPPVTVNQTQTGKEEEEQEQEQAGLAYWAVSSYKDGKLEEIIDPHLKGEIAPLCLEKYAEIAVSCVLDQRINRPSMTDVVKGLELALELQEEAEKGMITTISESSLDEDDHDEEILSQSSVSVKMEDDACTF